MGYGVDDMQEFPALVATQVARKYGIAEVPVVNAGIGDNGNGRWLKFLRSEGTNYSPRLIVLGISENDFDDNIREHLFEITDDHKLRELPAPPKPLHRHLQEFVEMVPGLSNTYLIGFFRQIAHSFQEISSKKFDSHSEALDANQDLLTYKILQATLRLVNAKEWPVLAVTIGIDGQRLEELIKLFELHDVPWITLPVKASRSDLYYNQDGHWNSFGHSHAAELIVSWLFENEELWLVTR
ncbi:MAG: hypothetical protein MJE12_22400 [Alphaproteobacteria bacterium]|nr:hypothetical protein [Alphaproteobacteria bacterium]